jgi:lipoprotein-anchoring transpeptidase ErfK/SrfK
LYQQLGLKDLAALPIRLRRGTLARHNFVSRRGDTFGSRHVRGHRFMAPIHRLNRRLALLMIPGAGLSLAGCVTRPAQPVYYGPTQKLVSYVTRERPGTIVVDPANHFLYSVQKGGEAVQYEVGVGKEGYGWSGVATVRDKKEWPDWYPTQDILDRKPEIRQYMVPLRSGYGMHGGPDNPLGARALYLWQGNADTLYRIHGTNEPESIGHDVSAGCIRMRNEDVTDLYDRTPAGTKVVVLAHSSV